MSLSVTGAGRVLDALWFVKGLFELKETSANSEGSKTYELSIPVWTSELLNELLRSGMTHEAHDGL